MLVAKTRLEFATQRCNDGQGIGQAGWAMLAKVSHEFNSTHSFRLGAVLRGN